VLVCGDAYLALAMYPMPIVRWRAAIRGALYLFLGWLGLNALLVPLFGTLSYLAVFIFPLFVVLAVFGVIRALTTGGRWAWAYILGNIGVLLASVAIYVDFAIEYLAGWHFATVELYLASVLLALVIGVVVGVRVQRPAP
jgi:hypothetical protein